MKKKKSFAVGHKAWHYRMATIGGLAKTDGGICQYVNCAVRGFVLSAIDLATKTLMVYGATCILAWIVAMAIEAKYVAPNAATFLALFILLMVGIILVLLLAARRLEMVLIWTGKSKLWSKFRAAADHLCCTFVVVKQ